MDTPYEEYTDNTPMPFGKFKGDKLVNVPAKYLLWLWNQGQQGNGDGITNKALKKYIQQNLEVLKKEQYQ